MQKVRKALDYLYDRTVQHPLAQHQFETDGANLFVSEFGALINATQSGQLALRVLLEAHLKRIERDEAGLAFRLYPFVLRDNLDEPFLVQIDPWIAFGKPTLVGTGIPTEVISDRFHAGESITELISDYDRSPKEIEAAIRYERAAA